EAETRERRAERLRPVADHLLERSAVAAPEEVAGELLELEQRLAAVRLEADERELRLDARAIAGEAGGRCGIGVGGTADERGESGCLVDGIRRLHQRLLLQRDHRGELQNQHGPVPGA